MFRAVRYVVLQALALEVVRTLSMVAWTVNVGLVVITVVVIVGLALAAGVMAAVAAALLLADIGVADILTDCCTTSDRCCSFLDVRSDRTQHA